MSWTITFTVHLWWLWAYLAIGAACYLPIEWRYHSTTVPTRHGPFWHQWRERVKRRPYVPLTTVLLWPLAVWEAWRT